jgi:2-polyprenyl-6-methoxyphenol hydroxylase-like FAD-dependent oxidoreductase
MADLADVLIAGGGLAGSALAVLLGRAGLRVELYEERHFPREKPCGEGLMPAGVGVLRRLGLAEAAGGRPLRGVRYHGWGMSAEADFPAEGGAPSIALGQRRLHLDRILFEAARATPGVQAFEGTAVEGAFLEHGRAAGLRVEGTTRRAAVVVAADGAHSPVRRSLGLDAPRARRARLGVRTHFRLARGAAEARAPEGTNEMVSGARAAGPRADGARAEEPPGMIEVFMGDGHELYVTPLPDDQLLVAGLSDRATIAEVAGGDARAALAGWIAAQPLLRARLEGAEPLTAVAGRSPLAQRARAGFAPGAVLLGDAAGFIDPVTAGGMAQALLSAELLAPYLVRAIAGGAEIRDVCLQRFDGRRRALLRDYNVLTRFVLFLVGRPRLARGMLRLMRAQPRVMSHLIGVAGGVRRLISL